MQRAPEMCFVSCCALRNWIIDCRQRRSQLGELACTLPAFRKMKLECGGARRITVEIKDEVLLARMIHLGPPCIRPAVINGSSSVRIFLTARKTVFFTASSLTLSTLPISETDRPSK